MVANDYYQIINTCIMLIGLKTDSAQKIRCLNAEMQWQSQMSEGRGLQIDGAALCSTFGSPKT